ncbi:MAG: NAD(P)H-binding protein [Nocardioidaceae bacterium]|nr:NAD(P)H-binding protein [Nocardioidaceae bacterium]
MHIAVYGATGAIGSRIVEEARARGHEVTGISRRGGGAHQDGALTGDALDAEFAARVAEKHDVVVSAIGPSRTEDDGTRFADSVANLVRTLGDRRLVVVGGAGSLTVDGVRLVDTPQFPEIYQAEALKGADTLALLRATGDEVDWTYLSPAPVIAPGERTGVFKLGLESPVGDQVSIEDHAVALVDEIEKPAHVRQRFTVAN